MRCLPEGECPPPGRTLCFSLAVHPTYTTNTGTYTCSRSSRLGAVIASVAVALCGVVGAGSVCVSVATTSTIAILSVVRATRNVRCSSGNSLCVVREVCVIGVPSTFTTSSTVPMLLTDHSEHTA